MPRHHFPSIFLLLILFQGVWLTAQSPKAGFRLLDASRTGITFKNVVQEKPLFNFFNYMNIYNGGGIAAGDLDGDGFPELFFTGNMLPDRLYKNNGNLSFDDITQTSGIQHEEGWTTGVSFADVNGDGLLDIYVCKAGDFIFSEEQRKNKLYINKGNLRFVEMAETLGLADPRRSNQATFFDYDHDGDLDLYVMNHPRMFSLPIEERIIKEKELPSDESDQLYRQEADGTFTNVTREAGVANWAFGLGLVAADLNDDGWVDLYVANDYSEKDNYWINQGDGTFAEGLFRSFNHISNFSMGVDAADFNNDLIPDICTMDMMASDQYRKKTNMSGMNPEVFWDNVEIGRHYQYMQNTLQLGNGNGTFSEIAELAGVSSTDWSWSVLFGDLDNDGFKDMLITNGMRYDMRNNDFAKRIKGKSLAWVLQNHDSLLAEAPVQKIQNYVLRNNRQLGFEKMANTWGVKEKGFSNGAVVCDLDRDGDLDMVFNNLDAPASVYENRLGKRNYLQIELNGLKKNRYGLGAKIIVETGEQKQLLSRP